MKRVGIARLSLGQRLLVGAALMLALQVVVACSGATTTRPKSMTSVAAFQASRRATAQVLVVECSFSDRYLGRYSNLGKTHYAFRMSDPTGFFYAYVPRDSEEGRRLFALMGNHREWTVTVEVICNGGDWDFLSVLRVLD